MSDYDRCYFETPDGWREYIVREWSASPSILCAGRIGMNDLLEIGDVADVECWGPNADGPYRDVTLRRTCTGWVEAHSSTGP